MYNFLDFTDKLVVIAGGSSGIGRQTAITLSRMGARVVLIARREEKLKETISMMGGDSHVYYVADLNEINEIDALVKKIVSDVGPVDGLVYCSGMATSRPMKMVTPEFLQGMMQINFLAFYEIVRSVTKKRNCQKGMRIVGISSVAAQAGGKAQSAYSASKAAMDAAVRVMAQELADRGICINTIRCGMTDTDNYKEFLDNRDEVYNESLLQRQFLGIADPQDIANVIVYLLSPAAGFITGANISADGGYTCH